MAGSEASNPSELALANRRHLASVLRQGCNTRILTPVWESSGESRIIWVIGAFMRLYSRMTIVDEGVVGAAFFGGAVRAAAIATEEIGYGH